MIEITAAQVAVATGGRLAADPDVPVGSVVADSRQAQPGSLYVARIGEHSDGHDFAASAVQNGASLVLCSRPLEAPHVLVDDVQTALGDLARYVLELARSAGRLTVIAITGSVGKTTTKDLLGQVLSDSGPTIVPTGSFNNEVGLPLTVLRVESDTRFLVLEMGASHIGDLTYLTGIAPPDIGVVLAVGSAHVGEFGSVEAIAKAKSEMVQGLAPGGIAVLNGDDLRVSAMAGLAPGDVVRYRAVDAPGTAQIRAADVHLVAGMPHFTLVDDRDDKDERAPVALQLVGEHHVSNALAAAAAALATGVVDVSTVAKRLSAARALSPHRMQVTTRPDGITIIDDAYNANPDSMRAGLKALAVVSGRTRRTVAVLGEMLELGDESRAAHDAIGELVVRLNIDLLVVVGEGAGPIFDGANREGSWGDETRFVPDVEQARELLARELLPGDVVLVKSSLYSGLWRLADILASGEEKRAGGRA